jgi:tetratricopeptide (TPR) repeat protein
MAEKDKNILSEEADGFEYTKTEVTADTGDEEAVTDETAEQTYQKLVRLTKSINSMVICNDKVEMFNQAARQFRGLSGYKDSEDYAGRCRQAAKQSKKELKKKIYKEALRQKNNARLSRDYRLAAEQFRRISGYRDADGLALECDKSAAILEKKTTKRTLATFAIIAVCFVMLLVGAATAPAKYYLANVYMMTNSYNSAIKLYQKLEDYKDSQERLTECQYQKGLKLMEEEAYKSAAKAFTSAGDYKDSPEQKVNAEKLFIKAAKAGDTVTLGNHDWMILELDDSQALLMRKAVLPGMAYNDIPSDVTWETSTLRQWLNSEFLSDSFSEAEKSNIILTDVINASNERYGTDGGKTTRDYVYLMSIEEAQKYNSLFPAFKSNCWLRSPGNSPSSAAFLSVEGNVMDYGYAVDSDKFDVRPVLRFNLQ